MEAVAGRVNIAGPGFEGLGQPSMKLEVSSFERQIKACVDRRSGSSAIKLILIKLTFEFVMTSY